MRRHLEDVLASADFDGTRRSREFLRFIVDEVLAGRGDELTQSAIASRVFGRGEAFDPTVDPIVRIQAGRLRRSLERYYLLSGRDDLIRIGLPRGSYAPTLTMAPPAAPVGPLGEGWSSVVAGPFLVDEADEPLARLFEEELGLEMACYRNVRVVESPHLGPPEAAPPSARFGIEGRLRRQAGGVRVSARLRDHATGEQLWAEEFLVSLDALPAGLEDVARAIAAHVACDEGAVLRCLAADYRRRAAPGDPQQDALLRAYAFLVGRDLASLGTVRAGLRELVALEPDAGQGWLWLARLDAADHTFDVTADPPPINVAIASAQNAVSVDPASRAARCVLAWSLIVKGELRAARAEVEQALRLAPQSFAYLEMAGFLLGLVGDHARGADLCRTALARNPRCLNHAYVGIWYEHTVEGDHERAWQSAFDCRDGIFFLRGVMRASSLGHLGRGREAGDEVAGIMRLRPDFRQRGLTILRRFLKFPEVLEGVAEGLERAGLRLEGVGATQA